MERGKMNRGGDGGQIEGERLKGGEGRGGEGRWCLNLLPPGDRGT